MQRRMRNAMLSAAVSIGVSATAFAGPTPPGETVLSPPNHTASSDVVSVEVSPMPQPNADSSEPVAASGEAVAPTKPVEGFDVSLAQLVSRSDPSLSLDPSNSQGVWHPGLADGGRTSAPLLANGIATDAAEQSPVIPLPNSAWTGLTMLALLAVARLLRNVRRSLMA